VPQRGEIVWLQFDPQAGHEQAGLRPALVVSPAAYNSKVGLALLCPITNQVKGYPFEVAVPPGLKTTGVILADQVKSLDWRARSARRIATVPPAVLQEVLTKIGLLLSPPSTDPHESSARRAV
jgi:mRNA interferase MazF